MTTVGELADLVRSKNAGPFWMTLDIFCGTPEAYRRIADEATINQNRVAELYRVSPGSVRIFRLPDLSVVKISIPRPHAQGGVRDRDMHAGQQHVPLAAVPVAVD
jgi:hypothetical protein